MGKSSLLNAWSRSDRAIVTDLPGTTRDVVESQLVVGGIPIQVLDTAGIRDTGDRVEQIGVERSRAAAQSADLILFTLDAQVGWTEDDATIYTQIFGNPEDTSSVLPVPQWPLIWVLNKVDLVTQNLSSEDSRKTDSTIQNLKSKIQNPNALVVQTAAALNQGIDDLENAILETVNAGNLAASNLDMAINQRQAAVLTRAKLALEQTQMTIADQLPLDFWTIDLRSAIQALGEITGDDVTESVLDRIFSRFCIGK